MLDLNDPEMLWLNITNIVLGLVTLACCVIVGYGVVKEVLARIRKSKTTTVVSDDHAFFVRGLGVTMADGGKRVDKASSAASEEERNMKIKLN